MSGGKGSTSTSTVSIPPSVLAQYNAVNAAAQQTAQTPFQQYGGEFVAPVNAEENTGIAATNTAATQAQPYYSAATGTLENAQAATDPYYSGATSAATGAASTGTAYNDAATGLAAAGAQAVDPTTLNSSAINQYLSPYLGDVAESQEALDNQQYQQAQSGQLGTAISSGAFGGDRTGVAAANLQQQQSLANNSEISGILNTGYNTALSTAEQQQGVGLSAAQANRSAVQNAEQQVAALGNQAYTQGNQTSSQLAGLGQDIYNTGAATSTGLANIGSGAQTAALQGANAQLAAGQVQQSTQQAQDTAEYNQFLQQQSYPFQVDQFLANIAEGTGSLSGSTTSTNTVQNGIFSDKRLKEDIKPVGKTYDGQIIYSYRYKGDTKTQIGLLAQDVEKKHPGAVGLAAGFKTVDYDKATDKAAKRGHFAGGGLATSADLSQAAADYQAMYGSLLTPHAGINGGSIVPAPGGGGYQLHTAQPGNTQQPNMANTITQDANAANALGSLGSKAGLWNYGNNNGLGTNLKAANDQFDGNDVSGMDWSDGADSPADLSDFDASDFARGGRLRRAVGGGLMPYDDGDDDALGIPDDTQRYRLPTAQTPNSGNSGGGGLVGDIGGLANAGLSIAKLIPLLATGGRAGFATGGSAPDPTGDALAAAISPFGKFHNIAGLMAAQEASPESQDVVPAGEDDDTPVAAVPDAQGLAAASMATPVGAGVTGATTITPAKASSVSQIVPLIAKAEGTKKNPDSSAIGPFQILNGPLKQYAAKVDPALYATIKGMSNDDLTAYRQANGTKLNDTYNAIGQQITADNFNALKGAGLPTTPGAVYLAHFVGIGGAKSLLKADPSTPVSDILKPAAIKANSSVLSGKTAGQVANWAESRMAKMATSRKSGGRTGYDDGGSPDAPDDTDLDTDFDNTFDPEKAKAAALAAATKASQPDNLLPASYTPSDDQISQFTPTSEVPNEGLGAVSKSDLGTDADVPDPSQHVGFIKGIGRGEATSIIPLLAGIGALATTQTNNPLTAVAAGLGAGAQAAQGQREFGLEQQYVQNNTATAQANAAATKANALLTLQNVAKDSIGNAQAGVQFQTLAKSYLQSGILTPSDLKNIPAPQVAPSLSSITPNLGAPTGVAAAQPPVVPQSGDTASIAPVAPQSPAQIPQEASSGQSLVDAYPNLANVQPPAPATLPTAKITTPYDGSNLAGSGVGRATYAGNPDWQSYLTLNQQADQLAARVATESPLSPLFAGDQQKLNELRTQAATHKANADAAYASNGAPMADAIRKTDEAGSDYLTNHYSQIANATKTAADAMAQNEMYADSGAIGKWYSRLASIGVPISDQARQLLGSTEKAERARGLSSMFTVIGAGGGAQAQGAELRSLNSYGSNDPGPAAGYDTAVKTRALADRQKDFYQSFADAAPKMTDQSTWISKWAQSHPLDGYIQDTVQNTPFAKGMTKEQAASYVPAVKNADQAKSQIANGANYINVKGNLFKVVRQGKTPALVPWSGD